MKYFLTTAFALFLFSTGYAQILLRGIVKDANGKPIDDATVMVYYKGSSDTLKTLTNGRGIFLFKDVKSAELVLKVTHIGYDDFLRVYDYTKAMGEQAVTDIALTQGGRTLENVTVQAAKVLIKEDTVTYKIDSTMFKKNDNVEEVLKKLPGVEVDNKTGKVTAQGQEVTKVKVNGKDFFGGDVTTATRNLDADMVDKIDIVDDYGDQAAFTGVRGGDPSKTMNIQLKKEKNKGWFGNATLGAGTDERYNNNLSVNRFDNNRQISLIGNLNNTNAGTFNFGSFGMGMGGMVRAVGASLGGGGTSGNGITATKSIGLNFRDEWGTKVSAYGNYSFSNRGTRTISEINRQNIFKDSVIYNVQNNNDFSTTLNHRFGFNIEYRIDSFNYLKFSPSVNLATSESDYLSLYSFKSQKGFDTTTQKLRSIGKTTDVTNGHSPNFMGSLLFNHKFNRKGRVISFNFSGSNTINDADDYYSNPATYYFNNIPYDSVLNQFITQNNKSYNYGANVSYIEPFDKKKSLEINYAYNKQFTGNDKENFRDINGTHYLVDSLSNIYDNDYVTNRFGVNFRNNQKKYNYSIGMAVQPGVIISNSLSRNFSYKQNLINYYPVIRFAYNFSRSRSFSINYNGNTRQPSYTQLQPVTDISNPQYITIGNPSLRPEFSNTLNLRYNNFDFVTGNVFFGNISFTMVKDKIVSNVTSKGFGVQETRYLNANGAYSGNAYYAISKPIQNRKFVFNYGGSLFYNNNLSYISSEENKSQNIVFGQRFSTTINLKKWFETNLGVNFGLNDTKYSLRKQLNTTTRIWSLSHSSRFDLPKNWIITYSLDKSFNSGYANNIDANPFIINAGVEKQVSKKYNASLRLNAYDLLNENIFINRTVTSNYITDSRINKLGRYALLSLVFRFNKYVGQGPKLGAVPPPPPPPPPGM